MSGLERECKKEEEKVRVDGAHVEGDGENVGDKGHDRDVQVRRINVVLGRQVNCVIVWRKTLCLRSKFEMRVRTFLAFRRARDASSH